MLTDSRDPQAPGVGPPRRAGARPGLRTALSVGLPLLGGLVHVALIAPHYFVGSFDDDASYILAARALAAGHGLTAHVTSGGVVAGPYAPGYPALLAPLAWAFPHTYVPMQLLSVLCFGLLFPLTWIYLGRRGLPDAVRTTTLVLLALCPVAATFAQMVMAEMPFLVVLLAMLLALDRWEASPHLLGRAGVGAVLAAVALVWLKEAAAAVVVGMVVWLVVTGKWRKGAAVAVAVGVSLVPVAVARLATGVPLAGSRYSRELGTYYTGGLVNRVVHVAPTGLHAMLSVALPATIVPRGVPIPQLGVWAHTYRDLAWVVTVVTVFGAVVWWRRHRDGAVVVVVVYLAETLLWPYINERRVILVLPVILAWCALGAWTIAGWGAARARRRGRRPVAWPAAVAIVAAAVVIGPLVAQFSRDYLYGDGQDSSRPQGSRYMAILSTVPPGSVVESDYLSTTALFTGRPTAEGAFLANIVGFIPTLAACAPVTTTVQALAADDAGYLLTGSLNKPFQVDSPCLLSQASSSPWAVRLLRTERDGASVFEMIGPGTVHPDLRDLISTATVSGSGPLTQWQLASQGDGDNPGVAPVTESAGGQGSLTWSWDAPAQVSQVSVGGARSLDGATSRVEVQLLDAAGRWSTVASSSSGVGDAPGRTPYLLATLPSGTVATALRVVIDGAGRVAAVDVHALGPIGTPAP